MSKVFSTALGGALALAGALAFAAPAAATTVQLNPGSPVDGINWSINPTAGLLQSAFYNANVTPQDADNIGTIVGGWFGVTLTNVPTGNIDSLSGQTLTYNGPAGNVFAIHIGQAEFAFLYSAGITNFTFTEDGKGLSNLRVYCSLSDCTPPDNAPPPGQTPVPGAAWLMGSVVGLGLGAAQLRRRRIKAA
jgi:hypothetical protein